MSVQDQLVCLKSSVASFEYDAISSITRTFTLTAFPDELTAAAALFLHADCPATISTLVRHPTEMVWVGDEVDDKYNYEATVTWDGFTPATIDAEFISGTIGLRPFKQLISYAYNSAWQYDPDTETTVDATNSDFIGKGLTIGRTTGGVDSDEAILGFQIRRLYPKTTINVALVQGLTEYVGFPNIAPWRGFGIGTVRILMVDFSDEDPHYDQISWTFGAAFTWVNFKVGNVTIPLVYGWNHVEPTVEHEVDDQGRIIWSSINYAQVHQLKAFVDLNDVI